MEGNLRTVYIDESFFKWTGLGAKDVNLAYGAVSIPAKAHAAAKKRWKAFEALVRECYLTDVGRALPTDSEIKSTDLRRLSAISVKNIGTFLSPFLEKHHIKVFGIYVMAEGSARNSLRNDAFDSSKEEFEKVIANQDTLYDEWLQNLVLHREEKKAEGNGSLGVLENTIKSLVSCILNYHLDCTHPQPFRLVWDFRSGETEGLKEIVAEFVALSIRALPALKPNFNRYYRGSSVATSHEEVGLRFADIVAGSFRNLFREIPELLTDDTDFEIKSACFNDQMLSFNLPFYKRPMDEEIARKVLDVESGTLFPHLAPSLAGGFFTYITNNGDARHCSPGSRCYFDMAD